MFRKQITKNKKRLVLQLIVIILAAVVLVPQFYNLFSNSETIENVSLGWIILAFCIYLLTTFLSSASYIFLSPHSLSFFKTLLVQTASGFTNRILPSGTGAIAINTLFLKKSGNNTEEAISVTLVNNLLGFLGFIIVMIIIGGYDNYHFDNLFNKLDVTYYIIGLFIIFSGILIASINKKFKKILVSIKNKFTEALKELVNRPVSAFMSLLSNSGITIIHLFCLIMCIYSIDYSLPISATAVVLIATVASISVSPTPNGLGTTEVVMVAVLQTYGIPESQALVVALSYRLVTYWLPILPGIIAYKIASSRNII